MEEDDPFWTHDTSLLEGMFHLKARGYKRENPEIFAKLLK
jgi:hypothetical protein